jgi:RNA polymerase-binding transcription factor DksA
MTTLDLAGAEKAAETGDLRADIDFGGSFADAAAVTAERTEVLGVVESLKAQLANVDQALGKIAAGTYGTCEDCGRPIPAARLEARPESVRCVDCKSKVAH